MAEMAESLDASVSLIREFVGAECKYTSVCYKPLYASWLNTALGSMIAIADEDSLHLLEFTDRKALKRQLERLMRGRAIMMLGETHITDMIRDELALYFSGKITRFATPTQISGTQFQQLVFNELMRTPYGKTISYKDQAKAIGREVAQRAVANANGSNPLAIIVPCHRVIGSNGHIGGYAGGIERKRWLIEHENSIAKTIYDMNHAERRHDQSN